MAFARVQGNKLDASGSASSIAVTLSAAVGSGNLICGVVGFDATGGATLSSVTDDKGNTYNLETSVLDTVATYRQVAFSRTNITNAPITITANLSIAATFRVIAVDEFSGGSTASTDERDGTAHGGQFQSAPGTATDAITSGTFTTAKDGDLLFGGNISGQGAVLATNGTGFSTGSQTAVNVSAQNEYRVQTTAAAGTAATFTQAAARRRTTFLIALKSAVRVQGNIAQTGNTSATTIAVTLGAAVGNGNAVCGAISWVGAGTLSALTDDKGNTYNLETAINPGVYTTVAFSRTNITNSPITFTATFSAGCTFRSILVDEFSGFSTASTDERDGSAHGGQLQSAPGTATDAITSGNFTTTKDGDLLWGFTTTTTTTALATVGTSFTGGTTGSTSVAKQSEYRIQATAAAGTAATFTQAVASDRQTVLIAIKAPVSAVTLTATNIDIGALSLGTPNLINIQAASFDHTPAVLDSIPIFDTVAGLPLSATPLTVSSPVIGTPVLINTSPLGLTVSSPVLGTPSLVNTVPLGLTISALSLGTPAFTQKQTLAATPLTVSTLALPAPNVVNTVPAGLTVSSPVLGAPAFGVGTLTLVATPLTIGALALPGLRLGYVLPPLSLTTASPTIGAPVLINTVPVGLTVGSPVLPGLTIGLTGVMTPVSLTVANPALGTPNLVNTVPAGLTVGSPAYTKPALVCTAPIGITVGSPVFTKPSLVCAVPTGLTVGSPVLPALTIGIAGVMTPVSIVVSSPVLGTPNLVNTVPLGLAVGSPVLDKPALGKVLSAGAGKTVGSPVLGTPSLICAVPLGIAVSSPVLGAPAMGVKINAIAAPLTVSALALGTPNLICAKAAGITVGSPVIGAPALVIVKNLSAPGLTVGAPALGAPILKQVQVFAASGLTTGAPVVSPVPRLLIHGVMTPIDLVVGSPVLGKPALRFRDHRYRVLDTGAPIDSVGAPPHADWIGRAAHQDVTANGTRGNFIAGRQTAQHVAGKAGGA